MKAIKRRVSTWLVGNKPVTRQLLLGGSVDEIPSQAGFQLKKDVLQLCKQGDVTGEMNEHLMRNLNNLIVVNQPFIDVNTVLNVWNTTPLLIAAEKGNEPMVRLLLLHSADVNYANKTGLTPLLAAAENGHLDLVRQLRTLGGSVEATTRKGATALSYAISHNRSAVVKLLVEDWGFRVRLEDVMTAVHTFTADTTDTTASREGLLVYLIDRAPLNPLQKVFYCDNRMSLVMYLVVHRNLKCMQYLYSSRGFLVQENENDNTNGMSPLMIASQQGYQEIVTWLLQHKADANQANSDGDTAMHWAVVKKQWQTLATLLIHNGDPFRPNNTGQTPADIASLMGRNSKCAFEVVIARNKAVATLDSQIAVRDVFLIILEYSDIIGNTKEKNARPGLFQNRLHVPQ